MRSNSHTATSPFDILRTQLVDQLRQKRITDEGVLRAIGRIPRELFVSSALRAKCYDDNALPIGDMQTISQPYTVAYMTQILGVRPGMRILEIGTGSGYQAAVLAEMGADVVSIERLPKLSQTAREVLSSLNYSVNCRIGDGTIGWKEGGPYDGIIVTAGAPDVPESLAHQLTIGGLLVVPVGSSEEQTLYRVTRTGESSWKADDLGPFRFVPLIGIEGWSDGK